MHGPCYHMMNVGGGTKVDWDFWTRALDGKVEDRDWVDFLQRRGFRAGVDYPISIFYKYKPWNLRQVQCHDYIFPVLK